jgi:hypothetical protein
VVRIHSIAVIASPGSSSTGAAMKFRISLVTVPNPSTARCLLLTIVVVVGCDSRRSRDSRSTGESHAAVMLERNEVERALLAILRSRGDGLSTPQLDRAALAVARMACPRQIDRPEDSFFLASPTKYFNPKVLEEASLAKCHGLEVNGSIVKPALQETGGMSRTLSADDQRAYASEALLHALRARSLVLGYVDADEAVRSLLKVVCNADQHALVSQLIDVTSVDEWFPRGRLRYADAAGCGTYQLRNGTRERGLVVFW